MLEKKTKKCTQLHAGDSAAGGDTTRATDTKKMEKFVSAVQTSTWLSWWAQVKISTRRKTKKNSAALDLYVALVVDHFLSPGRPGGKRKKKLVSAVRST